MKKVNSFTELKENVKQEFLLPLNNFVCSAESQ